MPQPLLHLRRRRFASIPEIEIPSDSRAQSTGKAGERRTAWVLVQADPAFVILKEANCLAVPLQLHRQGPGLNVQKRLHNGVAFRLDVQYILHIT